MAVDDYLIRNFKFYNPNLAERIASCEATGPTEIIVTLDNGERVIYDDMDSATEYIRENFDEYTWRSRFGRRLLRKMQFAGLNRKMLSERSGVSLGSIGNYISGKCIPSLYIAECLANAIGCSVEDLLNFPR